MTVTQHARWTATFRVFMRNGVARVHSKILLTQLFHQWKLQCGLREADLTATLDELLSGGSVKRQAPGELPAIELTDRGLLQMQRFQDSNGLLHLHNLFGGLAEQLNTRRVLALAQLRIAGGRSGTKATRPPRDRRSVRAAA